MLCERDPGDHRVSEITGPSPPVTGRHEVTRLSRSRSVKRGNAMTDSCEKFVERLGQHRAPTARDEKLESKSDFKNCH
jgi:hypothetical protein